MTAPGAALPDRVVDPGLQPERTSMSWGRTSLAYVLVAAVTLRWAPYYGVAVVAVVMGLTLVAAWIYGTQRRRYRRAALGVDMGRLGSSPLAVIALTVSTVVLGVIGLVFVAADTTGRG